MTDTKKTTTKKPSSTRDRTPVTLASLTELGPDRLLFVIGGGVATSPSWSGPGDDRLP